MKKFAVIFPGQGSQSVGMLDEFEDNKIVINTIKEASLVLDYDLWQLIAANPDNKLNITEYTQPALLAASIAMWRVFKEKYSNLNPEFFAGHSLGEYSALVAAESLSFTDAVKLVSQRGKLMQQACPAGVGGMAAILGLENNVIEQVCNEIGSVSCANYNAIGQTVIAGQIDSVKKAAESCKAQGAKLVKVLDVSVPSHCDLMLPMQQEFTELLAKIDFKMPNISVVSNVSAKPYQNIQEIRQQLSQQLNNPVQWVDSIKYITDHGIQYFAECGPGQVLAKLIKRIDKNATGLSINNISEIGV